MTPLVKGIVWAVIGFAIGALIAAGIRAAAGMDPVMAFGPVTMLGYTFGLAGWVLGIGSWDAWIRDWLGKDSRVYSPPGIKRYFGFNTDHKVIGIQYMVTFVGLFLLGGLMAMAMRAELAQPGEDFLDPATYNHVMSMHGIIMITVAVGSIIGGFGNYFVPLMIGAEDMAFPKLNALSYWLVPPVPVLLIATFFVGGWDTGWTGYPPLAEVNKSGQVLYNLAFFTIGLSSIVGSINFIVTIAKMRAPGMNWFRMPIFVWSIFAVAILGLIFTQFLAAALLMVLLDRVAGMGFFDPDVDGKPLVYQHLFWFYSHPAVYIMVLPGLGLMLELLTHFSRKPLAFYRYAVAGFLGITALSAVVWAHHMFTSGMASFLHPVFLVTTEFISIPTGLIFLSAVGTIWMGRLRLTTPMLFALAALFNFLIGGITGIFLADVPTDFFLQDTYFVVAHFHYTIVGAEIFALFGGIYYWFPKMTGRMLGERLSKVHFWWMFIGFNLTFIPMFLSGTDGMNRRIADYPSELSDTNLWASISGIILGIGFIPFVYNFVVSWRRGETAGDNPWDARTLEWQTTSPPPVENFDGEPEVTAHPYDYGVPDSKHAVFTPHGGAQAAPAGGD